MANSDREPLLETCDKDGDNNHVEGGSSTSNKSGQSRESSTTMRLLSALFYASSSFFIMILIKNVLTANKFPSFQVSRTENVYCSLRD